MTNRKRKCGNCNRHKERHLYHADQWKLVNKAPICKSCRKKYSESYRGQRDKYYRDRYDITLEEYEKILDIQGGVCFVCRKKPGKRRLAVDHDHEVAKMLGVRLSVRGLLCHKCNEYLGHIGDDEMAAKRMASYLVWWPSESVVVQ